MKELEYFLNMDNKTLVAYNEETEFFARFIENISKWEKCKISFMQFEHDYCYKLITKQEALKITKGKSVNKLFKEYLDMLDNNLNSNVK